MIGNLAMADDGLITALDVYTIYGDCTGVKVPEGLMLVLHEGQLDVTVSLPDVLRIRILTRGSRHWQTTGGDNPRCDYDLFCNGAESIRYHSCRVEDGIASCGNA